MPLSSGQPSVLYVLPIPCFFSAHGGVGGHVAHVHGIIQGLVQQGYGVRVLAEEPHETLVGEGIDLHVLGLGSRSLLKRQLWARRLVRETGRLVGQAPRPAFCYTRYSVGFSPWLGSLRRVLGGVPLVLELNSFAAQDRRILGPLERRNIGLADLVVCVSGRIRELVGERLSRGLQERTMVLPNAVDVDRFRKAEPATRDGSAEEFRIGYAGTLKPDYDVETLIEAFGKVARKRPRATLHIYGDGVQRGALEALSHGLERIVFHGAVPFLQMPAVLRSLDVAAYTMTQRNSFGSSTKIFEYMAAGRPMVAADTPGVRYALGDGRLGLLYPSGDADALAEGILRLMADKPMRDRLGRAGMEEARRKHSWSARVGEMLSELRQRGLIHAA